MICFKETSQGSICWTKTLNWSFYVWICSPVILNLFFPLAYHLWHWIILTLVQLSPVCFSSPLITTMLCKCNCIYYFIYHTIPFSKLLKGFFYPPLSCCIKKSLKQLHLQSSNQENNSKLWQNSERSKLKPQAKPQNIYQVYVTSVLSSCHIWNLFLWLP